VGIDVDGNEIAAVEGAAVEFVIVTGVSTVGVVESFRLWI
jgi:hypothetical protein